MARYVPSQAGNETSEAFETLSCYSHVPIASVDRGLRMCVGRRCCVCQVERRTELAQAYTGTSKRGSTVYVLSAVAKLQQSVMYRTYSKPPERERVSSKQYNKQDAMRESRSKVLCEDSEYMYSVLGDRPGIFLDRCTL